jgi:hypothetical protein
MIMNFKCDCSMTTRVLGDGCQKCNTDLTISSLPTPVELADELKNGAFFTDDQANHIAAEVYQPLLSLISTLNAKINEVAKAI